MADNMTNRKSLDYEDDVIDLLALAQYLLHHWLLLLLALVVGATIGCAYAYSKPYTYTSDASIFIESETTSITSIADIQLGMALSSDFVELAGSRSVVDAARAIVKGETGMELERGDILGAVSVFNKEDTRLLVFNATTTDPSLSCILANAMAKATAEEVSAIMKTDEPTFVDMAEISGPNGKGMKKLGLMGAAALFAVVCGLLMIPFLTDDKITTEEDVKKYLDVNVLGTISVDKSVVFHKGKKK